MEILPNCSHINTVVWLHHFNFNEVFGEKARWEQHKDAVSCFEQVSVLLYGCTTWSLMKFLKKKLDGDYTRML